MRELIDKLYVKQELEPDELKELLIAEENQRKGLLQEEQISEYLFEKARQVRHEHYGNKVFTRGLIELSNYCKNDCYYCGIRRSNTSVARYRLNKEDILNCCQSGYDLGFRTFVLQGGEDSHYNDNMMADIIYTIKSNYPDCAVTLSLGEKEYDSYLLYFHAGADRYLLRHETSNPQHYRKLHPEEMSLTHRKKCLEQLKEIGYQVGCGIMVGSPFQTVDNLVEDLLYIKKFQPHMVGIGPFIPHHETPFAAEKGGTAEQTLFLLGLIRLMLPKVLLPATTALGTINPRGRELGILAGANVVMPNLSPVSVRKDYELYDNKICTGDEAAECRQCLDLRMKSIDYEIVVERGDFIK
ncbi:MAG: [FeFe] hydrogenase H-cluster radical SAM maturase HydE [Clostridiales bacterium]|jgi:biotin synthase|nr:[FeFe] hydrogenase H-cluster radical SAM maturase HydE [Clostridiales bacterium]